MGLKSLIKELESIAKQEAEELLKEEMLEYGEELENALRTTWDNWLSTSSMAYSTGATSSSFRVGTIQGRIEDGMAINVNFGYVAEESYLGGQRIPYLAVDEGWFFDDKVENYSYMKGQGFSQKAQKIIESMLPSYIKVIKMK